MYQKPLIFLAILAAAAAAFAVVLLTAGGSRAQIGGPLLERSVFGATSIEALPAGADEPVRFALIDGAWVLASDGWPANQSAVRGTLRFLGETAIDGAGAAPDSSESRVVLGFDDGEQTALWIEPSSRAVGGGAVVRDAMGRFGHAPVGLAQAIESLTADSWRSPAAMPEVEIEASRIAIEREGGSVALARVDGRWFLREPARTKADDRAVAALLGAMIDLRATRFGGDAIGKPTIGLRGVRVEKDRRVVREDGTVDVEVETTALRVLGPADAAGEDSVVDSNGVRMVVRTERLNALDVAPGALASRTAASVSPADVGMIVLRGPGGEIAFRRTVLEWRALGGNATALLDPAEESGGVERLLAFLANARAESVRVAPADAGGGADRFIQLFNLDDQPIATLGVVRGEAGGVTIFEESRPEVRRVFGEGQIPRLLRAWLETR